jgi:CheY-like chemotaxis protein
MHFGDGKNILLLLIPIMKKILILENSKVVSNMISTLLNNNDYKILSSENYSTDHGSLKQIPDLVIADLTSIKKEKVELLMQLKNNTVLNMVPFLLISSHKGISAHTPDINFRSDEALNQEQYSILNYHLRKPFTKSDLHALVKKILDYMDGISPW